MTITIKDLATMANTSTATISRVLSNKPGVTDAKRRQVLELAQRVGYSPNRLARNLALKKSYVLGFVAADLTNPAYVDFIRRVNRQVKGLGYQILIADSERDAAKERQNLSILKEHRAEGIIIFPVHDWHSESDVDHLLQMKLQKFPFVLVGRIDGYGFDYVTTEEVESSRKLAAHLVGLGHRRIGFVGSDSGNRCIAERLEGFRRAHGQAGLPVNESHVIPLREDDSWISNLMEILRHPDRPTALVFVNDVTLMRAYRPLLESGLRLPEDLSLATYGDGLWATTLKPSITITHEDARQVASLATSILLERMEDPALPPSQRMIAQEMVIRESTVPPGA